MPLSSVAEQFVQLRQTYNESLLVSIVHQFRKERLTRHILVKKKIIWELKHLEIKLISIIILTQWIALKAHADWLVKLQISFAIYLPPSNSRKNGVLVCIHNKCGVYYLTVLVYTKTTIHPSVGG